jgi:SWI/SNF-related matrix-associated actin-dependent regulator 1 of chromatin subfamily A
VHCGYCGSEEQTSAILTTFQLIQGVRFDWSSRPPQWTFPVPFHDQLHAILEKSHGMVVHSLPPTILAVAREKCRQINDAGGLEAHRTPRLEEHIPECILMQLAPFQKQGVEFILRNEGRALLADDMGLGKTRTSVAASVAYTREWPVLVVCPSSARHNWNSELANMLVPVCLAKSDILIVESASQDLTKLRGGSYKFIIISYNLIQKLEARIKKLSFGVIICDECHYLKNSRANRTKALAPLLKAVKRAILISGTPALSRPMELFTQLNALNEKAWPDEKAFGHRYCRSGPSSLALEDGASDDGTVSGPVSGSSFHTEFKGASNTQELHVMLTSTLMIRRLKTDILLSLPRKKREVVKVEVHDKAKRIELRRLLALFRANEDAKGWKAGGGGGKRVRRAAGAVVTDETAAVAAGEDNKDKDFARLAPPDEKMSLLLQLFTQSGEAKLPAVLQHIQAHLDDPTSGKILVFGHHRVVMDAIAQYVESRGVNMVRIDGQTSGSHRHENTRYFQTEPKCRVALLAITAAGIAITLTAASTVFFAEMFWTPGSIIQAEDRAHRIGQRETVNVKYFLADDTVDEVLWPLLKKKVRTLGEVVEGGGASEFADIAGDTMSSSSGASKRKNEASSPSSSPSSTALVDFSREVYDLTKDLAAQELETARTQAAEEDRDELEASAAVLAADEDDVDTEEGGGFGSSGGNDRGPPKEPDVFARLHMAVQNKRLNDGISLGGIGGRSAPASASTSPVGRVKLEGSSDTDANSTGAGSASKTPVHVVELLGDSDDEEALEESNAEAVARRVCERLGISL